MTKSSQANPRKHEEGGWEVDLARDDQDNCRSCGAAVYWIWIKKKDGTVKRHPVSEALTTRRDHRTLMASHYADCPDAKKW